MNSTNAVSWNPLHCEVYPIQHYVIKFVSDLRQAGGFRFSQGIPVSSANKADRYDIAEILLKVALITVYSISLIRDIK